MKDIKVSIICNAYNHENYIRDAIESFLMQKTNFGFEVLIHDDASTDKTPEIIKAYEKEFPDIIKPIYQKENKYSRGISIGLNYQYPRVKGKYIAVCEGDDYWTDPYKLQKQYDALEKHPEVDMCAHTADRVVADTKEKVGGIRPSKEDTIFTAVEVINGGGGFVATNSLMYRAELVKKIPEFRKILMLDYTLQIQGSLRGGMLYLKDDMSAYRVMAKGSWTSRMSKDLACYVKHMNKVDQMLTILNKETDFVYDKVTQKLVLKHEFELLGMQNKNKLQLDKKYKIVYRELSLKDRIKIRLKAYFPFLLKLKRKSKVESK